MGPVTWVVIGILVAAGTGFGAGWGLKPKDDTAAQIMAHTEAIAAQNAILVQMAETASRPVVLDAEIRDKLANTPPACLSEHGEPDSLACMVQMCWQYGQSAAQRPSCQAFETEMIRQKAKACPETQP